MLSSKRLAMSVSDVSEGEFSAVVYDPIGDITCNQKCSLRKKFEEVKSFRGTEFRGTAVSYTHLDVYKRQSKYYTKLGVKYVVCYML